MNVALEEFYWSIVEYYTMFMKEPYSPILSAEVIQ